MPVDFIITLIILSFAFRIVLMAASLPLHFISVVLITPATRGRIDRAGYWASLINPVVLAAVYGGFIALITAHYTSAPGAVGPLVYLAIGALAAFFSLVSYAEGLRAKAQGRLLGPDHTDKALWVAASFSLAAGLAAFVLFYLFPGCLLAVPGTDVFFRWTYRLAAWLSGYRVVQIILAVCILGYVVYVVVRTLVNSVRLALGGLKRLLQRLRWWLKPAPEQEEPQETDEEGSA
ncbi:MAG: hypothetical protein JXQ83_13615 [Candidatus Glassbacteria bacterium]|nr:hypothetical protein [Candidatus Glassbacteria bacterium]